MTTWRSSADDGVAERDASAGFTLIEVLTVMSLIGIIATMAVAGLRQWTKAQEHEGARREVISSLRYAQERAVAEATTYCVEFTGDSWSSYRVPGIAIGPPPAGFSCAASGIKVRGPVSPQSASIHVSATFTQRDNSSTSWALFYGRGSATGGTLNVTRDNSSKRYTINVEGLTSRVATG